MLPEHMTEEELKGEYCSLDPYSPAKDTVAATKKKGKQLPRKKESQEDQNRHQLQAIRNLVLVL